jgi:surface antigen
MRPDLWNNRSPDDPAGADWTAHTWPAHAALEGLTIDHAPAPGAVIVWPRSVEDRSGHAAYVQSVSVDSIMGDRLVTLQEMNDTTFDDPARGQGDTMTMAMAAIDLAQVQIIHAPAAPTRGRVHPGGCPPRRGVMPAPDPGEAAVSARRSGRRRTRASRRARSHCRHRACRRRASAGS